MDTFSDVEVFKNYASQYNTSSRTFITLNQERIERIKDISKRSVVAFLLGIGLDESGNLVIDSKEKATRLINLCYKTFQDAETANVLKVSTVTMLSN